MTGPWPAMSPNLSLLPTSHAADSISDLRSLSPLIASFARTPPAKDTSAMRFVVPQDGLRHCGYCIATINLSPLTLDSFDATSATRRRSCPSNRPNRVQKNLATTTPAELIASVINRKKNGQEVF